MHVLVEAQLDENRDQRVEKDGRERGSESRKGWTTISGNCQAVELRRTISCFV